MDPHCLLTDWLRAQGEPASLPSAQISGDAPPQFINRYGCEFRYVGIPVIWRRRDAQTLRPMGNGRNAGNP